MAMIVLYPGSFDPPHLGHYDLIRRAAAWCERLIVAVAINPEKQPFLSPAQRVALLGAMCTGFANVEVVSYSDQTAAFARSRGAQALLRGVRHAGDLATELGMAEVNRTLGGIETLFLPTASALAHVSSALVRQAIAAQMPLATLVPETVATALREHAQGKRVPSESRCS